MCWEIWFCKKWQAYASGLCREQMSLFLFGDMPLSLNAGLHIVHVHTWKWVCSIAQYCYFWAKLCGFDANRRCAILLTCCGSLEVLLLDLRLGWISVEVLCLTHFPLLQKSLEDHASITAELPLILLAAGILISNAWSPCPWRLTTPDHRRRTRYTKTMYTKTKQTKKQQTTGNCKKL